MPQQVARPTFAHREDKDIWETILGFPHPTDSCHFQPSHRSHVRRATVSLQAGGCPLSLRSAVASWALPQLAKPRVQRGELRSELRLVDGERVYRANHGHSTEPQFFERQRLGRVYAHFSISSNGWFIGGGAALNATRRASTGFKPSCYVWRCREVKLVYR